MSAVIEAEALTAGYGGMPVVRDVNLKVRPGEVVALLGPNGAGRSTVMRTLAGELKPIAGAVRFLGETASDPLHRRARRGLSFVPEESAVFATLSTRQNIRIGRCESAAVGELFPELEAVMSRRAGLLSGGEQQMLALGRALARTNARVLLADELSLGLAPLLVSRLLSAVRKAADAGLAVLLVEQHVHRVLEVADRVHVLAQGRIRYSGSGADAAGRIDEIQSHYLSIGSGAGSSRGLPAAAYDNEGEPR